MIAVLSAAALLVGSLAAQTAASAQQTTASDSVEVGQTWYDTDGNSIQAHGGGFLEHDGWYYWVGENKSHDSALLLAVSLYRSQDLINWEFAGDILTRDTPGVCSTGTYDEPDCKIERPKLVYNEATDKFVLWGHWETADSYAASHLIVATSDTVDGDYTVERNFRPGVGEVTTEHADPTYPGDDELWGYGSRDFTVFQDPDTGDAYLVGSEDHLSMRLYPLTDDYTDADWQNSYPLFVGQRREAPALVKADGRYVLITSAQSGWYPNQGMYATTDDITDPDGWSEPAPVGNNTTFKSQPTNIMTIQGSDGRNRYIYMGDRWEPSALGSSTYVWLPLRIDGTDVTMDFHPEWGFDPATGTFDLPEVDLASEHQPVTAAVESQDYPPEAANDGIDYNLNTSGDSTNYYLPSEVPFSWEVDLGSARELSRVDLSWRQWNGSETYSQYTIRGSVDGDTWDLLADRSGNTTVGFTTDPLAGRYRYARIDVSNVVNDHNGNGASWAAGLVEAQVYAAESTSGGTGSIVAAHSGKCADVADGSTENGAEIQQWGCDGASSQQWRLQDAGDGYVRIVSEASGKCLDVEGQSTVDGARVLQWDCHGGSNQQWEIREAGDGHAELVARHSGKCLDVSGASTADGTRLQQYECWCGDNQRWSL
ncbi:RICIN domain-containing protein [Glycomyces salinus]|uniref:RICIN domain-containing protein n=1 Tax=Glycomyces salinus TaxID=980294 RepID=UPI0018ED900B|nr:RICIN domain-containing protein [Glycomyces salinus]